MTISNADTVLTMTDLPPPPPPAPAGYLPMAPAGVGRPAVQLTGAGKRFGAWLLDLLLLMVTLVIGYVIWSIILWGKGQSPAKSILKMRVVAANEFRPLGRGDMALRSLVGKILIGSVVPFYLLISGIFVLADDRNQALWDKIAKSVVVDDPDNIFNL
jgi:uncharacterized RDD family membrane protein YckC